MCVPISGDVLAIDLSQDRKVLHARMEDYASIHQHAAGTSTYLCDRTQPAPNGHLPRSTHDFIGLSTPDHTENTAVRFQPIPRSYAHLSGRSRYRLRQPIH